MSTSLLILQMRVCHCLLMAHPRARFHGLVFNSWIHKVNEVWAFGMLLCCVARTSQRNISRCTIRMSGLVGTLKALTLDMMMHHTPRTPESQPRTLCLPDAGQGPRNGKLGQADGSRQLCAQEQK